MTRVTKAEFESAIKSTTAPELRSAVLGALLAGATGSNPVITGGSAIAIRTEGRFVTKGVDIIGLASRISPVLRRWGFVREVKERGYWTRRDLGLLVDVINRADYPGLESGLLTFHTPYGPVRVAASEDLILRRLIYWSTGGKRGYTLDQLMDQAVTLFLDQRGALDDEYLEVWVRQEGVEMAYSELRRRAEAAA